MQTRDCTLFAFVMQPRCNAGRRSFKYSAILETERSCNRIVRLSSFFSLLFVLLSEVSRSRYKRNNGLRGNVGAPYVVGRRGFRIPRDATKSQPPRYVQQETSNKNLIERSTNSRRNVSCKRCTLAILRSSKKYIHLDVCTRRETRLFPYFTSRRISLNVIVEEKKNH